MLRKLPLAFNSFAAENVPSLWRPAHYICLPLFLVKFDRNSEHSTSCRNDRSLTMLIPATRVSEAQVPRKKQTSTRPLALSTASRRITDLQKLPLGIPQLSAKFCVQVESSF